MESFAFWMIFPIFGILAGMFKQWLRFKERQNQLGNSTQNLEKLVEIGRAHV